MLLHSSRKNRKTIKGETQNKENTGAINKKDIKHDENN